MNRKQFQKALFWGLLKVNSLLTKQSNLHESILELKKNCQKYKNQIWLSLLKFRQQFKHKQTTLVFLMKQISQTIRLKILSLILNVDLEEFQNQSLNLFWKMLQLNYQEGHEVQVKAQNDRNQKLNLI